MEGNQISAKVRRFFNLYYLNYDRLALVLIVMCLSEFTLAIPKKLPVKAFASLPEVSQMSLSPNGENILSLVRIDREDTQGTAVKIVNIKSGKSNVPIYAENQRFRISWVKWANNTHILVSAIFPSVRGGDGTPTTETRLLILDTKTGKYRNGLPPRKFDVKEAGQISHTVYIPQFQDNVIDLLPDDKDNFLLSVDNLFPGRATVYSVSLKKNRAKKVQPERINIDDWITDQQGNVRIGLHWIDTLHKVMHKLPKSKKMEVLWEYESFSEDSVVPLGFAKDPHKLYIRAYHEGRKAVFLVDVTDPELKRELVWSNKKRDVGGDLIYSNLTKDVIGIGSTFWDETYKAFQASIDKALPNADNDITYFSKDEQRYIVHSSNGSNPGAYYLGMRDEKSLNPVAYEYPLLLPNYIANKKRISYMARDGVKIKGFLTLPVGSKDGETHPTIIFPHGGPISFDGSGFDYWTQFFANRGYAVLQMNFRGSSGYGYDFMKAGLKGWGLAMQDDVEDGARWAISEGYANADKMCIVGASYGGYAALMGAVKTPDMYKCVISFAGVTDIAAHVKSKRRYRNYEIAKEQIGSDLSELKKRSPYYLADNINVPVLLIHGSKDRSVRVKQSQKMNKALAKRNKVVTYVELDGADHHLSNNDQRIETFELMDKFLAKYLQ